MNAVTIPTKNGIRCVSLGKTEHIFKLKGAKHLIITYKKIMKLALIKYNYGHVKSEWIFRKIDCFFNHIVYFVIKLAKSICVSVCLFIILIHFILCVSTCMEFLSVGKPNMTVEI